MPIYRKLLPTEYPQYTEHLLRLPRQDRYSRFAGTVSDTIIQRRCSSLDWSRVTLIGAFHQGHMVGAAEVCTDRALWPGAAELALSVDVSAQSQGVGGQLARRALTMARNRGIHAVHMLCLADNRRMRALARRFGGHIEMDAGEAMIVFHLPPPNQFSLALEALEDGAGVITAVLDTMQTARGIQAAHGLTLLPTAA